MTSSGGYGSAFRGKSGKGQNRNNPLRVRGGDWKQITTQGEVSINLAFSHKPFVERLAGENYLGRRAVYPNGAVEENHKLTQFELLLNETGKPGVFASLNGFAILDYASPTDLARKLRFAGVVKSDVRPFSTQELTASGVAVRRFGTASVPLKGIHAFHPGDRVSLYLPPFEHSERFCAGSLGFGDQPSSRLTPLVRPFDYKDVRHAHLNLLKTALSPKLASVPLTSLNPTGGASRRFDSVEQHALWFKAGVMAQAAEGIVALMRAGHLRMDPTVREELWRNLKDGRKTDPGRFDFPTSKLKNLLKDRDLYVAEELRIAELLGMTINGGGMQPYMYEKDRNPHADLHCEILRRIFYTELKEHAPEQVDETHRVLHSKLPLDSLINFTRNQSTNASAEALLSLQGKVQQKFMESVTTHMLDVSEQVIGVALQTANPGETPQFDILMGGRMSLA